MAVKPCPYRKEHEWEWDTARQLWECSVCYTVTDKTRPAPLVPQDSSETPTPPHPFMAIGPKAVLVCAVPNCNAAGKMTLVSSSRWATRCPKHQPRWRIQDD